MTKLDDETVGGIIVWIIILSIAFWYWHCWDGVRAVKNAHCYELVAQEAIEKAKGIDDPEAELARLGYNTSITLQDAIEKTNPYRLSFKPTTTTLQGNRTYEFKGVTVFVSYEKPWHEISRLTIVFAVEKAHFWHFNPRIVAPTKLIVVKDGKEYEYYPPYGSEEIRKIIFDDYFGNPGK